MFAKAILPVLSFALLASAAPPTAKRATYDNGHTTNDAKCCVWFDVLDDIQSTDGLFEGGQCGEEAHESLRLTFHDAIGYSPSLAAEEPVHGSIVAHSDVEMQDGANTGMDEIVEKIRPIALAHNVSFGDIIQFVGAVGVSNCMGGPQLQFMAGRSNASTAAPAGLIPGPADSVDDILARMGDAGFTADEVVDLLASHSVAAQDSIDPSTAGTPLDTTPSTFDAQFFVETLLKGVKYAGNGTADISAEAMTPLDGEFRMVSDQELARDSRTACRWQSFVTDQDLMVQRFTAAMAKMAVLGQDVSSLTDCSDVIPQPKALASKAAVLPAGTTIDDIEASCAETPFPSLAVASS
ncbi:hypothetical protein C8T65DRAFT_827935 [Cerioporus squamosus]|nr:hypothetical protein C8T65DRAFT_827935 [Cerioporus squamosus]